MSCSCVLCGNGRLNKASTAFACEAYVLLLLFVVNFVVVVVLAKMAIGWVDDDFDENDSDASFKATEEENDDDFDVDAKTEPHTLLILVALFNSAAAASAEAAVAEGFVAAAARLNMMPSIGGFFCGAFSENKIEIDFCFLVVSKFSFFVVFLLFRRTFHISQHFKSSAQSKIILSRVF